MNPQKTGNNMRKVIFALNQSDWHGYATETVWGELVSTDTYRIMNTPFFAKGVSFEDTVLIRESAGNLFFERIIARGSHSTYRILVNEEIDKLTLKKYWEPLEILGCTYESMQLRLLLLAVDVPPTANIYEVYDLLKMGETENVWGFEEGHFGHAPNEELIRD